MFKKITYFTLSLAFIPLILGIVSFPVNASIEIGEAAPNFVTTDIHGKEFNLEKYNGKIIVLEWTNHLCPFVRKHYETGNMQAIQKTATDNNIIWVTIVSSAEGKQGFVSDEEAIIIEKQIGANATTRILDPSGEIGKLYNAKTTPHMFIISKKGKLAYTGAIDSSPSPNPKSINGAKNLVTAALNNLLANQEVKIPRTAPYGCSIKY